MTACFIYSELEYGNCLNTDISQGSVVTQLTCGGIVSEDFVANLLMNLSVEEFFENQSIFGEVMGNIIVACFFIDSHCICSTAVTTAAKVTHRINLSYSCVK